MSKILLLEDINLSSKAFFESKGYQVDVLSSSLETKELITELKKGYELLGLRSKTKINTKVIENKLQLKAISMFGIGLNHIDLEACQKAGLALFNALFQVHVRWPN